MNCFVFDTNIVILYLKKDPQVVLEIQQALDQNAALIISAITLAELFSFPKLSEQEEKDITAFASSVKIVSVDERVAREAGKIRRIMRLRLGDSIIAATTVITGGILLTRDKDHFHNISSVTVRMV